MKVKPVCPVCGSEKVKVEIVNNDTMTYKCLNIGPDPDEPICGALSIPKKIVPIFDWADEKSPQQKRIAELEKRIEELTKTQMPDKDLDGLVDEFATNGFPLDGEQFRETLRGHFGPVFDSLKERIAELEKENREQHYKLTKACVEGGYDICARCGEAVYTDEMATIPAYRKKVEKLEKEVEKLNKTQALCHCGILVKDHDPWSENHYPVELEELCPFGQYLNELITLFEDWDESQKSTWIWSPWLREKKQKVHDKIEEIKKAEKEHEQRKNH